MKSLFESLDGRSNRRRPLDVSPPFCIYHQDYLAPTHNGERIIVIIIIILKIILLPTEHDEQR